MKKFSIFLLSVLISSKLFAIDVGGTYEEDQYWTLAGSPYNFTSHVNIYGCTLYIQDGVVVNLNNKSLLIETKNSDHLAFLNADNVTFNGTGGYYSKISYYYIYSNLYGGGGSLTSCELNDVYVRIGNGFYPEITNCNFNMPDENVTAIQCIEGSTPIITGNTINGGQYNLYISSGANPTFSGNTILNTVVDGIGIGGDFEYPDNYTLQDYGYPYYLTDHLNIYGITFTISPGLSVNIQNHSILVETESSSQLAFLNADNVTFNGTGGYYSKISYYYIYSNLYGGGGSLTSCELNDVYVRIGNGFYPEITNCNFNSISTINNAIYVTENSNPIISNNIIIGYKSSISIGTDQGLDFIINQNDFINPSDFGIFNNSTIDISAIDNYWGHPSGPYHPTTNPSGQGCQVSDYITYDPWSTLPNNFTVEVPEITTQPVSQNVEEGESVTFIIEAIGSTPLFYQWKKDGSNIINATNNEFTIEEATLEDEGDYTCEVSNIYGSVLSDIATLTVNVENPVSASIFLPFTTEHEELTDGMASPGEPIEFDIEVTNNTSQYFYIKDILIFSEDPNIVLDDYTTNSYGDVFVMNAGQTYDYSYPIRFKLLNWPTQSNFTIGLKILGGFTYGPPYAEYVIQDLSSVDIYIPPVENHMTIEELQDRVDNGTINFGEEIVVEYTPFFGVNNCDGCAAFAAAGKVIGFLTGMSTHIFTTIATEVIKEVATDYVLNTIFEEEMKYKKVWLVAGRNSYNSGSFFDNMFITNDPVDLWNVPKIGYPVKVIAKLKRLQDFTQSHRPYNDPVDLPILEPYVFTYDTASTDGYTYLYNYFWNPEDENVKVEGLVHQYWQDITNDNYYFTLIQVNESPSNLWFFGDIFNIFYSVHMHRVICQAGSQSELPELGSFVQVKGVYRYLGAFNGLQMPSNWTGSHPQLRYLETEELNFWCGNYTDYENPEVEFFNTNRWKGPVAIDLSNYYEKDNPSYLHLYDLEGNHTGPIYDESGNVVGLDMNIPGSHFAITSDETQFIIMDTLPSINFVYEIDQLGEGFADVTLSLPDVNDTIPEFIILNEQLPISSGNLYQNGLSFLPPDTNGIDPGITAQIVSSTYMWYVEWSTNPNIKVELYIGNISNNMNVELIDVNSILINDQIGIIPGSEEIISNHPAFEGDALKFEIYGQEAINTIPGPIDNEYLVKVEFLLNNEILIRTGLIVEKLSGFTSIKDYKLNINELIIVPNPSRGEIGISLPNVSYQSELLVNVFDNLGQKVYSTSVNIPKDNYIKLQLNDLNDGYYFISVRTENNIFTGKLLIKTN